MPNQISVTDLATLRNEQPDLVILDVREDQELAIASIPGARHIPLGLIPQRHAELAEVGDATIYCLCHHGMRSARAQAWLASQGYQTCNIVGGIDAWSLSVDQSVPRY